MAVFQDGGCSSQMTIKNNFYAASYKKYLDGRIDNGDEGENLTWWEISAEKLQLGEVIGAGEFGVVVKGVLDTQRGPTDCAVKMLKSGSLRIKQVHQVSGSISISGLKSHDV